MAWYSEKYFTAQYPDTETRMELKKVSKKVFPWLMLPGIFTETNESSKTVLILYSTVKPRADKTKVRNE